MKPKLIGLYSPRAQSGKSTVAWDLLDRGFVNVKFAGPIKDMVRGLLRSMGLSLTVAERMVEGDWKDRVIFGFDTVTPRHLMQTLGTDWGREAVDKNLWTQVAMAKAESLMGQGRSVVIDDLRFPNEHAAILDAGGECWRIVRPDAPEAGETRYEGLLENHDFHQDIYNTGTLDDLRARVVGLVDTIDRMNT